MKLIKFFRQLTALLSCGLTLGLSTVLLATYWASYEGGHYAVVIATNQYGEFWPEIGLLVAVAGMSLAGLVEWTIRIHEE